VQNWQDAVDNSVKNGVQLEKLETPEAFRAKAPVMGGQLKLVAREENLLGGCFANVSFCRGWKGVYDPQAGWTHAYKSLLALYNECVRLGVAFECGSSGTAKTVIYDPHKRAVGILAEDGTEHRADRVILACGGWMDSVIDTKGQCLAKW
jgi:sarcosine oxidase/L-pipecolate oxidase